MLINVTINHIDFDISPGTPMAEFTVEVGTPELSLKGTFNESVDANTTTHWVTYGESFDRFVKACEHQLSDAWVHCQGTDFRDAILNELYRKLHHADCDERTQSGGGRCNCDRLPGGHALTDVLDEVSNRLNRFLYSQNQQATS